MLIWIAPFILLRTYILYSDILVSRVFSIVCSFFYSYSLAIQYNGKLNLTSTSFVFFHPCKIFFVQQTVGHIVYLLKKTSKNHWHCKNRQRFEGRIGYQILIFRHYHIPPWYPIHLPSQIPIYQSLISHIIHHKYENFYPPSIDLKFKIGGFFYFKKKLKNFCSEGVQNASPSSNKWRGYLFRILITTSNWHYGGFTYGRKNNSSWWFVLLRFW